MQNFIVKGLNGQFKIVAATQYITRIKDSTNKKKIKTDPGLTFTQGTLLVAYYIYARYEKNPRNSE